MIVRRRPTLPQGPPCSTIGATRLSLRVRNVTGRFPRAMTTETLRNLPHTPRGPGCGVVVSEQHSGREQLRTSPRPISTGQLHPLQGFHIRPINPVVYWEPYPLKEVGILISKQASRLDAFSGYPSRT